MTDLVAAARRIRKHYGLNRPVTEEEAAAELQNLRRKKAVGALDSGQELLAAALNI